MFEHFVAAQDPIYATALAELTAGGKRTHWMCFIFPQLRALGRSERAIRFGLADLTEAKTYLAHQVLGPRLRECTHVMLGVTGRSVHDILHAPDDLKFRSSMTLFVHAAADPVPFRAALDKYHGGTEDPLTRQLLGLAD